MARHTKEEEIFLNAALNRPSALSNSRQRQDLTTIR
jgi:hypothetical protein